jgi:hypothetical protein
MTSEERRKMYLAKAKEAEEQASKTQDHLAKDQWLKIAEAYRLLAKPN